MCKKAVEKNPHVLCNVPDYFKTQEMRDKAVRDDPFSSVCVPDWFVTQQQINMWHDDDADDDDDDNKFSNWYEGYQKCKAQKVKIEEELMHIAWHPSSWWDWCLNQDEKKKTEKLLA